MAWSSDSRAGLAQIVFSLALCAFLQSMPWAWTAVVPNASKVSPIRMPLRTFPPPKTQGRLPCDCAMIETIAFHSLG